MLRGFVVRGMSVGGMLLCSLGAGFAQKTALPSFEVASIKPAAPMESGRMMIGMRGGPGTPDPVQMTFTNVSLSDLIQTAWDVKSYQVTAPGWLESARFDIAAKVPEGATKEQSKLMLQDLLAERFGLVLHHSTKEESIYALLVAKNGPKLKESVMDPNAAPPDAPKTPSATMMVGKDGKGLGRGSTMMMMAPGGRMRMMANGISMTRFVDTLARQVDRPILDMTGLKGTYDISLEFAPDSSAMQGKMAAMGAMPPPGGGSEGGASSSTEAPAATIFSALPEQLGLRLEARKGPVDLLIVDSVKKVPTEN